MGLGWSMSAAVATLALVLIGGAIYNKAKEKKDSPLYKLVNKFKKKKPEDQMDDPIYYKRLSHKGGIKW